MTHMDKQRFVQIDFWAEKCKQDMDSCLAQTIPFIDSQIVSANEFYEKLAKTRSGKGKIKKLKRIQGF